MVRENQRTLRRALGQDEGARTSPVWHAWEDRQAGPAPPHGPRTQRGFPQVGRTGDYCLKSRRNKASSDHNDILVSAVNSFDVVTVI